MVHRKNLDTHAEGFAPTGIATPPLGEAVALPEASAVLDLLFQYMYPQPQPDLTKVEFSILAQLSEAAEKYQVYSAMEICKFHMQYVAFFQPYTSERILTSREQSCCTQASTSSIELCR